MTTRLRVNNVSGQLGVGAYTAGSGTIDLGGTLPAAAVPTNGVSYLPIVISPDTAQENIVYITGPASSGTNYPCAGGEESSTDQNAGQGTSWKHGPTALDFQAEPRDTVAVTTGSLASGAASQTTIALAKSYRILHIQTNYPARVRLYTTSANQSADASRVAGVDPASGTGVVLDYVTTGILLTADLSPEAIGADMATTPTGTVPITITNLDTVSRAITVTLTWAQMEI